MYPKRVVFVLPSFAGGGAERVLLTFAAAADRKLVSPAVVVLDGSGPWRDIVLPDTSVSVLGRKRIRHGLIPLGQTLRRLAPDVVVSTIGSLNLAVLAVAPFLRARTRIFVREANTPKRSTNSSMTAALLKLAYRRLYRRASGVIVPASYLASELSEDFGVPHQKISVVYNPVDVDALRSAAVPIRRHPGDGARFVAVGRLTEQKGFDQLLTMFGAARSNAHLTIYGDGPDRSALERLRSNLGLEARVDMPGFDRGLAGVVAGADALLLPSRWEGLPNVALEALALGTPVIAAPNAGGIGEIASMAEPSAVILAQPIRDFIAAMARVVPNPLATLRPSKVPAEFHLANAVSRFTATILAD